MDGTALARQSSTLSACRSGVTPEARTTNQAQIQNFVDCKALKRRERNALASTKSLMLLSMTWKVGCGAGTEKHRFNTHLCAFGLLLCQAQFDIAQSPLASQCTQCTVCCLGFCSALPDDEESEECWNAYQYYEDKRVCLTTHDLCLQLHDHMLSDVCLQFNSYISALCSCYSMRLKRRVKWNGKTMMA